MSPVEALGIVATVAGRYLHPDPGTGQQWRLTLEVDGHELSCDVANRSEPEAAVLTKTAREQERCAAMTAEELAERNKRS